MKPMFYKDDDGKEYKISFSEELQLKNLRAARDNNLWLQKNFYAKVILALIMLVLVVTVLYFLYRLDAVDFFTKIMYR